MSNSEPINIEETPVPTTEVVENEKVAQPQFQKPTEDKYEQYLKTIPSIPADINQMKFDMDDDTFRSLAEKTITSIKEDELVHGKIMSISKDEVLIDIGFKSLGIVPRTELLNSETLKIGDEIDVFIEKIEDPDGKLILSRRRADFMRIWEDILSLYDKQEVIQVRILRRIKGGMVVDLLGIEAFLPGSQIDVRPIRDFDGWVGKVIDVKVVKVNHPSENVVVSHKVLLEEQLSEQRGAIISKLEKGLVLEGTVKATAEFGIFVDLGGVDGLVHITDLSWGRVTQPSEIVSLDEIVKVVVLDFDEDKRRISLGMKQLTPHPWDTIGAKYEKSTKVRGKVVSLTDYGAFIEIEKGIEGLIHISEMSWTQHIKHPSQMVSMGQILDAVVLNIDKDDKKLALGMKQLEPDPWHDLMEKYPINSIHRGIVRNLTNFGVFVELEAGVDGLVHISDLSWTKKIRHPGEFVKKGDQLEVTVLSIDPEQRRIALGHKQIQTNPWDFFEDKFKVSAETSAKIERIIEKGVIVELPDGVDGFVPVSQLSFAPVRNISEFFHIGDVLPLRVVEFDKEAKKIVLSCVEYLRHRTQEEIDAYIAKHPVPNSEKYIKEAPQPLTPEETDFSVDSLDDIIPPPPKKEKVFEAKPVVTEEPIVAEEAPVVVAEEPNVAEEAPVVVEEPIVAEEAPVVVEEPIVAEEAPVVVEEPVVAEEAPVVVVEEPIVAEEAPVVVVEEPIVAEEAPVETKADDNNVSQEIF